jgi:low affinity Fe/Cu permease
MNDFFRRFAHRTSETVGSAWAFIAAVIVIIAWAVTGPMFGFSDTWQLVINTGTTIITFLMVFLIQNTQNRDAKAIHLKLDELIRSLKGARNGLINLEELSDEELKELQQEFQRLSDRFKQASQEGVDAVKRERKEREPAVKKKG